MSRNAVAATKATREINVSESIPNTLLLPTQQQQNTSEATASLNTTQTINLYPTTNGTPTRYYCLNPFN